MLAACKPAAGRAAMPANQQHQRAGGSTAAQTGCSSSQPQQYKPAGSGAVATVDGITTA